jgi:copper chaperone CopZ
MVDKIRNQKSHDNHQQIYKPNIDHDRRGCGNLYDGTKEEKNGGGGTEAPGNQADLESGPQYSRHLALGVSEMHCSTCTNDVSRILKRVSGVDTSNVKVSFIISRAELSYDPAIIQNVKEQIYRAVLKRFSRLEIVILVDYEAGDNELNRIMKVRILSQNSRAEFIRKNLVGTAGVESILIIDSNRIELAFDPDVNGIHDILS